MVDVAQCTARLALLIVEACEKRERGREREREIERCNAPAFIHV